MGSQIRKQAQKSDQLVIHFISLLLLACSLLSHDQNLFSTLKNGDTGERRQVIYSFFKDGKRAIPELLEKIDSNQLTFNELTNPTSSIMRKENLEIRLGAYAAYIIELILAKEELDMKSFFDSPFLLGASGNFVYWEGFIVNMAGKCISRDGTEMKKIAAIYRAWWERSKDKTIGQLRQEWKCGIRPLSDSSYQWK